MRTFIISGALVALLAAPAAAEHNSGEAAVGAAAGGTTGAVVGGLLFGPVGAIFGGFTGAVIGADAAVPDEVVVYATGHPVEPVHIDAQVDVGYRVESDFVHPIPDHSGYGYFYANGRAYIVDRNTGEIVYSPGFFIEQDAVAYARAHPVDDVTVNFSVDMGAQVPGTVQVASIPDYPYYGYVYVGGQPVLVNASSRTVIWMQG